jgi:hypothetical protein
MQSGTGRGGDWRVGGEVKKCASRSASTCDKIQGRGGGGTCAPREVGEPALRYNGKGRREGGGKEGVGGGEKRRAMRHCGEILEGRG